MGVFSKFNRFHEAGQQANVNNVERFGEPLVDHAYIPLTCHRPV